MHLLNVFLQLEAGFADHAAASLAHLGCQERAFAGGALARGCGRVSGGTLCAICSLLRSARGRLSLGVGRFVLCGGKEKLQRQTWRCTAQNTTCFSL